MNYNILYHGSSKEYSILVPKPSSLVGDTPVVYATPLRWLAAIFSVHWNDNDLSLGIENGRWTLVENALGVADRLFFENESMTWIHHVPRDSFHGDPRLGLGANELISEESVIPLKVESIIVCKEIESVRDIIKIIRWPRCLKYQSVSHF
jgi:hypothetical protein